MLKEIYLLISNKQTFQHEKDFIFSIKKAFALFLCQTNIHFIVFAPV